MGSFSGFNISLGNGDVSITFDDVSMFFESPGKGVCAFHAKTEELCDKDERVDLTMADKLFAWLFDTLMNYNHAIELLKVIVCTACRLLKFKKELELATK